MFDRVLNKMLLNPLMSGGNKKVTCVIFMLTPGVKALMTDFCILKVNVIYVSYVQCLLPLLKTHTSEIKLGKGSR